MSDLNATEFQSSSATKPATVNSNPSRLSHCPLCAPDSPATTVVVAHGPYHVVRCAGCKLIRLAEPPTAAAIAGFVTKVDYGYHGEIDWGKKYEPLQLAQTKTYQNQEADHRRLVRLLSQTGLDVRSPLRVHDIGCSAGFELFFGKREGWRVSGNDLDEKRREWARANLGMNFTIGYFNQCAIEDPPLDVALLKHVLEHVPDPVAELTLIRERLGTGGVVVVEVPNFAAPELQLKMLRQRLGLRRGGLDFIGVPEHLWQFTFDSLERMLSRCGFAVRVAITSSTYSNHAVTARWLKKQFIHRFRLGTHLVVAAQKV